MSWDIIPLNGSLGSYRDDWDRLNERLYASHPFFDSRFIEPLLTFFANGAERLCIHSRHGTIDGLLILTLRRMGVWSLFLPSQAQIAPVLMENTADLQSLFASLGRFPISIELQCQDPRFTPILSEIHTPSTWVDPHALTVSIAISTNFDTFWSSRSRKLQQNLRRYLRRTKQDIPSIRLDCVETLDKIQEAVDRYGDLESSGWKGNQGTSLHTTNVQGKFYSRLMEDFSKSGQVTVYELYLDDHLAASRLSILNSDLLIMLKTTYDETLSQYAPGRLLLYLVLEREFSLNRTQSIEFYTNANQDQVSWSTEQRTIEHITVFKNPLIRQAFLLRKKLARRN